MSILGTICLDWCALVRFQNLNGIYLYAHVKRFGRSKLKVNVSTRQGWSHDRNGKKVPNGRHFSHLSQVQWLEHDSQESIVLPSNSFVGNEDTWDKAIIVQDTIFFYQLFELERQHHGHVKSMNVCNHFNPSKNRTNNSTTC